MLVRHGDGDGVVDALVLDLLVEEVPRVPAAERHEEDVEHVDDRGEDHGRNHEPAVALADDDAEEEEPQREFERYLGEEIEDFVDDNPLLWLELSMKAGDAYFRRRTQRVLVANVRASAVGDDFHDRGIVDEVCYLTSQQGRETQSSIPEPRSSCSRPTPTH